MEEVESTPGEDAPPSAAETPAPEPAVEPTPAANFDHLRGFQALSPETPPVDAELYAVELVKELVARAERFRQSVDDSIVLASDGVIRWLGDPVGRLIGGDDVLKPRAVLLADDQLPAESREAAETRLSLWVAAHVRKVLGPLEALAEPAADLSDGAKDIARRVAESLGVLDRDRVRNQVKALDQNARAALRKLGVRFGASYIFVPALLKPAPRTLSMQLWSLRRGVEAGAERLLSYAAAGRTSFANEGELSPDAYRVAGFRLCGERVVRVDIVERLTDLIRAAIPNQMRPGDRNAGDASGFLVTPQMTSLTGCAGEAFAAILRSLGYESHQVKKSDWEAANRKPELAKVEPATPVVEAEAAPAESDGAAEAPETGDAVAAHAERVAEGSSEAVETAEIADVSEAPVAEAAPSESAAPEEVPAEIVAEAPEVVEAPDVAAEMPAEPVVEAAAEQPAPEPAAAEDAAAEAVAESAEPESEADTAPATPVEDEFVEVWRLAPRRRQPPPRPAAEPGQRPAWRGRDRDQRRPQAPRTEPAPVVAPLVASDSEAVVVAAAPPAESTRPDRRPHQGQPWRDRDGGKGRGGFNKGAPREDRGPRPERSAAAPPPRKEPRPQQVDMDSPFAKLLALKPLLSRRDERT